MSTVDAFSLTREAVPGSADQSLRLGATSRRKHRQVPHETCVPFVHVIDWDPIFHGNYRPAVLTRARKNAVRDGKLARLLEFQLKSTGYKDGWRTRLPQYLHPDMPDLTLPRVSVVLNNYNYGRFLDEAIRSAVEQSLGCEVIVVDDGSTDTSTDVLEEWQERVRVIRQPNAGQIAAYQTGFDASGGDIVIFLDADDTLDRRAAERVADAFSAGVAKVHYRMKLIDDAGSTLGPVIPRVLDRGELGSALVQDGLLYASAPGSGNAYRRSALECLFPLPPSTSDRHGADFYCTYGVSLLGRVVAIDEVLGSYRVHRSGDSDDAPKLGFGNAESDEQFNERQNRRVLRFKAWILERSGGALVLPARLTDFSVQKFTFAKAVLDAPGWSSRLRVGRRELSVLLHALWKRAGDKAIMKVALTLWACGVLLLPNTLAVPLARYVCNPASR